MTDVEKKILSEWAVLLGCLLILAGCSKPLVRSQVLERITEPTPPRPAPLLPPEAQGQKKLVAPKPPRKERPYAVNGTWYFPRSSVAAYKEQGICSWYGPDFHGKPTSGGEVYDMHQMTAAHRTLPFNTLIKVRNPANGKEVIVRVNDRGPFWKDRILDLSYSGAKALDLVGPGTAWIELEALGILEEFEENGRKVTRLVQEVDFEQGGFAVQVGAFKDPGKAARVKERLLSFYPQVEISEIKREEEIFYRVRLTSFWELEKALQMQKVLEAKGFTQAVVIAE